MRKTISLILSVLMILSSFSIITTISAKETNVTSIGAANSGTTGDCQWTFDTDTETLTIYGGKKMENYYYNVGTPDELIETNIPWSDYFSNIKRIVIKDGVTYIGRYSFLNCENLESVSIPSSVTNIGKYAFKNCSNIKDVYYDGSEKHLKSMVGEYNEFLLKANLHCKSVDDTGITGDCNWTFDYDTETLTISGKGNMGDYNTWDVLPWNNYTLKIKKIKIEKGVESIGRSAFYNCINVTNVDVADSVIVINNNAFDSCTSLTDITIPNNVTVIGQYVFKDCKSIESINIPSGVTSIKYGAFLNCTELKNINIPKSVDSIEDSAFNGCTNLSSIVLSNKITKISNYTFNNCSNLSSVVLPNELVQIGDYAFDGCSNLSSISIPNSTTKIGAYAFYDCKYLSNIKMSNNVQLLDSTSFCNTGYYYESSNWEAGVLYLGNCIIASNDTINSDYTVKNGTKTIANNVFKNAKKLKSLVLPNSIEYIGNSAFENCENISNLTMSTGLISVGKFAFSGCKNLTGMELPISVKSIGNHAFSDCSNLSSLHYAGTKRQFVDILGGYLSSDYDNINIYYGITVDGDTFENCKWDFDMTSGELRISGNGKMGDDNIFTLPWSYYSSDIKTVKIENGIENICKNAFKGCTNLEKISIPKSVTTINSYAFKGCNKLKFIDIDKNNKNYLSEDNVIYNKNKTKIIKYSPMKSNADFSIPKTVVEIQDYAFEECENLTNVIFPTSVKNIGIGAFSKCTKIATIVLPTNLVSINDNVFSECTNLTDVTIPNSINRIGYGAFEKCSKLKNVYYNGTKEQWDLLKIEITSPNYLYRAKKHYLIYITKLTLNTTSVTIENGKFTTVKATVTPSNASNKKLKWTTSNSKVAVVNSQGKITAKGRGNATIKVMALDGSNKYATVKVTVKQPVTSVKLNRKSANLKVKGKAKQKTVTLKATVYPKNANNKAVTWKSSNSKIATVNSKGKVTAKKKGTCFIYATAKDGSKKSAKCKIVVM